MECVGNKKVARIFREDGQRGEDGEGIDQLLAGGWEWDKKDACSQYLMDGRRKKREREEKEAWRVWTL